MSKQLTPKQILDRYCDMFNFEVENQIYMTWYTRDTPVDDIHEVLDREQMKNIARQTADKVLKRLSDE